MVLVVGIVRNCAGHLASDVARLTEAFGMVKSLCWFLVESDSDDATPAILDRLKRDVAGFGFVSLGSLRERMPLRTDRLAWCRNRYLDELTTNPALAAVDYVVVADFDGINSRLSRQAVESCWVRDDWDACTANQAGPYYDIWALRHGDWSPNDCFRQHAFMSRFLADQEASLQGAVFFRMITIPESHDWVEVESAFGGLAIYRRSALVQGRYRGRADDGGEVCEHVPLHADLRHRGCRIFINPRLVNAGYTPHTQPMRLGNRIRRRIEGVARAGIRQLSAKLRALRPGTTAGEG